MLVKLRQYTDVTNNDDCNCTYLCKRPIMPLNNGSRSHIRATLIYQLSAYVKRQGSY